MINIREAVFKVWANGMFIFFMHSKSNGHYCDTYCGAPESFSAPDDHVRTSQLPVIGTIEGHILNIKYFNPKLNI